MDHEPSSPRSKAYDRDKQPPDLSFLAEMDDEAFLDMLGPSWAKMTDEQRRAYGRWDNE